MELRALEVDVTIPQTPIAECQTFNWFKGEKGDKGDKGDTGNTGATGADGFSPTANVTKSGDTVTISITDKNGTTTESIVSGEGKAMINLSNIDNTNDAAANALNTAGIRTVVETYSNGTDWYRVWSDGWCEQGGLHTTGTADASETINLLKPFANTNYQVYKMMGCGNQSTYNNNTFGIAVFTAWNLTTTSFTTWGPVNGTIYQYIWKAEGYIS